MGVQSWLSLWFGLTLPAIVLMYMFKRKYVDTTVPSHLLWDQVLRNLEANRPWQKLQNRLLLWLQLLAAALMVFALMQPFMQVSGGGSAHVVIVADTSGSMSAQISSAEGEATRLALMQERIKEYVKGQGRRSEITLLSVGASPVTLAAHESDRAAIDKAVDGLRTYYGPAAYRETLSLASALTREETDAEVVIFTDSYWKPDTAPIAFQVPVSVEKVQGELPHNVSIDQFGISPKSDADSSYAAVAVISTNAKKSVSAEVNLYGDEQLLTSKVLELEPGKKLTESFANLPFAEVYRLELSQEDGYAADNASFAFGLGHGSSRVLLLTSGNLFLEKALQLSGAEVTRVVMDGSDGKKDENTSKDKDVDKDSVNSDVPPVPEGEFDLLVIDGSIPDGFRQGKWADLTAKTPLWTIGGEGTKVGSQGGRPVLAKHPVTAYVTLSGVYFGTLVDQAPAWGEPVIKLGDQPIVYAGTESGRLRLSFNFLLQDSDLPLSPEFPVMVSNALEWMTSGKGSGLGRYMAGAQADIPIAADTVKAAWIPKSGLALADSFPAVDALRNEQGISPVQIVPEYPGLYAFEQQNEAGEKLKFWLAVTADPYEADWSNDQGPTVSQSTPTSDESKAGDRDQASERSGAGNRVSSLMPWLAALALAVITAEWGVYQRGRSI